MTFGKQEITQKNKYYKCVMNTIKISSRWSWKTLQNSMDRGIVETTLDIDGTEPFQ